MDCIEPEEDIVVLQGERADESGASLQEKARRSERWKGSHLELIDEDGDGIQLVVGRRRVGHGDVATSNAANKERVQKDREKSPTMPMDGSRREEKM